MSMRDPEDEIRASAQKKFAVIQLERKKNNFIMRIAEKKDDPFILVGDHEMENLPNEIFAGIFICAHNADEMESATISNVRIEQ